LSEYHLNISVTLVWFRWNIRHRTWSSWQCVMQEQYQPTV